MEKKLATIIGTAAREARDHLDLNQREVAERIGIATEVYGRLERGHMLPSVRTLRKLCLVLNISSDRLLGMSSGPLEIELPTPAEEREDSRLKNISKKMRELDPSQVTLISQMVTSLIKAGDKHKLPYYAG